MFLLWKVFLSPLIVNSKCLWCRSLCCHVWSFKGYRNQFRTFWLSNYDFKVILMYLPAVLCGLIFLSCSLQYTFFVLYMFYVYTGNFFSGFVYLMFCISLAPWWLLFPFLGRKFSFVILLKIFSVPLNWVSSFPLCIVI